MSSAEENKAIFLRLIAEVRKGNLNIIDEVFSPDFVLHDPNVPGWPRGLEGARKMFTLARTAAPDMEATIEDIFAEGGQSRRPLDISRHNYGRRPKRRTPDWREVSCSR